jgi:GntR family transcriptional repressor for pyruvate dehydrogenase complex
VDEGTGAPFRAVRKRRASQDVVAQIQDLLISGRIRPGDRLPAERQLAETFNVARSTVREAYRALEALGLIRVHPGTATRVIEPSNMPNPIPVNGTFSYGAWDQQRQLFEVRLVLDPPIAGLAARRATTGHLAKLRATLHEQERAGNGDGRAVEADIQFHTLLFEASGNPILCEFVSQVTAMLRVSWNRVAGPDREITSVTQHRLILQAVETRDAEAAERHMRTHLQSIEELVLTLPG